MTLHWPRWNPRRLSSRIVAMFLGMLLLVQLASFAAIGFSIDHNARAVVNADLEVGERALQRLLAQNSSRLIDGASLLAADYGLRAAVSSGDHDTVVSALANHGERIGASISALLDIRFELRATSGLPPAALPQVVQHLAAYAAAQEQAATIELVDGRPTQFVMVPMRAPVVVGWVLLGFTLDQHLAEDLRDVSSVHLAVLARPAAGAPWINPITSLPPAVARRMVADLGPGAPAAAMHADGEEYGARVLALSSEAGAESVAVLLRSVDEAVAPYRKLQWVLILLTALGLVAFAIGSVITAQRVTTPIRRLAAAAERLGRGDYTTPVGEVQHHSDEIGELAERFEHMRVSIAGQQDEIRRLAYWDRLTGLPNRLQFREAVAAAIARGQASGEPLAVIMLDLDRFKHVNDVLGFHFGDQVLKAVAERLALHTLRDGDLVARLGGDEFAVLLPGSDAVTARAIAQRVAASFEVALTLGDQTVDLGAGIGIASWPQHAAEVDVLLSRAEVAMYAAKRSLAGPTLYDPAIDSASALTLTLLSELRHAVEHGELRLYLQPKIAFDSGQVIGAEALMRWQHPVRGLVPPAAFIPFAEQTGFVRQLTQWMFGEAARQWGAMRVAGEAPVRISVNLSTRDLLDIELPEKLDAQLVRHGVPAQAFCLEITESAIMDDPQRAEATLNRLSARGFKLSIDDFGTGYSSLAYLKRLPVDELKIDKSFVMGMERDADDAKIVRSTIDLAHNLGLSVVAEGVESAAIWGQLRDLSCDEAQGFHMSRPIPAADFARWRESWAARVESESAHMALQ